MVRNPEDFSGARYFTGLERANAKIRYHISCSIKFELVKWLCINNRLYEDTMEGTVLDNDQLFSSQSYWDTNRFVGSSSRDNSSYRYNREKIFLHMDKVLKVLTTLTRKTKYGSSAFSFRDS